ncbi:MAG: bifunctional chorismate mutase/prephenate dehydrogenase [Candidatus Obscuribacterales bacterium]|nr:bifunctional chorismate mutase/prephenate dehydrogenase [Candidatus Obscuribacterales bacterium]
MTSRLWPLGQLIEDPDFDQKQSATRELDSLRAEIDDIDSKLVNLLARRFELSRSIGDLKAGIGKKILDESREKLVIERVAAELALNPAKEAILKVFRSILDESVSDQKKFLVERADRSRCERLFQDVCVIGVGLIGGALSRQIKLCFPSTNISAIDLPENMQILQGSGLFDSCAEQLDADLIARSSLIFLACPPDESLDVLRQLAPNLRSGQLLVDLCSVKRSICNLAEEIDLNGAEFIGAHPFFGTEKSGFASSAEVQIEDRSICLVPTLKSSELSLLRLRNWFAAMNLRVFVTDSSSHDTTVALTSHTLQLLASSLGALIHEELIENGKADQLVLSGAALAGLKRLMKSRVEMWEQITGQNRDLILSMLSKLSFKLNEISMDKNSQSIKDTFAKASRTAARLDEI